MFRNESNAVIGKAKARERSKARSNPLPPPEPVEPAEELFNAQSFKNDLELPEDLSMCRIDQGAFVQTLLPSCTMFPSLEERGLSYFSTLSSTWLRDPSLVDDISNQSNAEEHLLASMSAVGLANFSNSVHAPEIMVRARRDYVNALQLTNAALRSPTEAKKDSTLFAVMLLGIFETITGNNDRSLAAWTEHINGAAALVKLRGRDQFKNAAGQRMFIQVTASLMLSCIQRTIPMPQHIVDLRKEAAKFVDSENPAWRLSSVIIDFTILRSDVRDCKIVGPKAVIEAALQLDGRFISVFENLPENWKYDMAYTDENPHLIWNGCYHVYKESWMAHIYNSYRTCRILLHEIIRDQLLAASTAMTPIIPIAQMIVQGEKSVAIMLELQADILASIPRFTPSPISESAQGLLEGSRSYFILWPLYLVGNMDLTTDPIREWAIQRLRNIGETVGIRQALVVAEYMERRKYIMVWNTKPDPVPHWRNIERSEQCQESFPSWEEGQELLQSHLEKDLAIMSQT